MWKEIQAEFQTFVQRSISQVIDGAFLVIWAGVQYVVSYIIALIPPAGIDYWVFQAFQVLFAISTLIPVVMYIYEDILKIWKRIHQEPKKEEIKNA